MTMQVLLIVGGASVAILGWLIFLTAKVSKMEKKANILFADEVEGSLGETLKKYLRGVKQVEDHYTQIEEELKRISGMAQRSLQRMGFVRYNPFGNVGGNQSFSLCVLDQNDDGFVISSIHSREGTRVYSKTISKGKSEFNLSEEEQKAVVIALKK